MEDIEVSKKRILDTKVKPRTFEYLDYRKYLSDFYNYKKLQSSSYSYGVFAKKAKISSRNYLKRVIDGERPLSPELLPRFIQALELDAPQSLYFENLVRFNQAEDTLAKEHYFGLLKQSAKKEISAIHLAYDQYDVLNEWYHLAIAESFDLPHPSEDPRQLSQLFKYRISPQEVRDSLELLQRLGVLKRNLKTLRLEKVNSELEYSGAGVNLAVQNFHRKVLNNALAVLEEGPFEDRYLRSLALSASVEEAQKIRQELDAFFVDINQRYSKREGFESGVAKDIVVQLNTQILNLTNKKKSQETK